LIAARTELAVTVGCGGGPRISSVHRRDRLGTSGPHGYASEGQCIPASRAGGATRPWAARAGM